MTDTLEPDPLLASLERVYEELRNVTAALRGERWWRRFSTLCIAVMLVLGFATVGWVIWQDHQDDRQDKIDACNRGNATRGQIRMAIVTAVDTVYEEIDPASTGRRAVVASVEAAVREDIPPRVC